MVDVASLVFDIDASGAVGAAKALAGLNKYAAATATMSAKLDKQFRQTNGQFMSQIEYVARNEQSIRKLADAYNPVLSAQLRFAEIQKDIATAVKLGVISVDQQADALRRAEVAFTSSLNGANKLSKGIGSATYQIQNMGYQISDIAVQLAGGQNPILVLTQQLPQMIGGLGIVGAVAGATAAVVGVLAMNFMGGADAAKKFNDSLSTLEGSVSALNEKISFTVPESFQVILDKYGSLNASVRETVNNVEALNLQLIKLNQTDVSGLFSDSFGGVLMSRLDELKWAFDTTYDRARVLDSLIKEVDSAKGPQAQIDAYDKLIRELIEAAGGINGMTSEQIQFVLELEKGRSAAIQGLNVLDKYSPSLNNATSAASGLLSVMQQISNTPFPAVYGRFSPDDMGLGSPYAPKTSKRPPKAPSGTGGVDWGAPDSDSGGSSGGGGGRGADRLQRELETRWETLNNGFKTEQELLLTQYTQDQETLQWALDQKLIAEDLYNQRRVEMQQKYSQEMNSIRLSEYSSAASSLSDVFGQMASLQGANNEKMLKAQKAFSAASALIAAYEGASKALADPNISVAGRLAAYGSVLAAGLGAVNAIKGASMGGTSGGAGGVSSAVTSASIAKPAEAQKTTLVRIEGDKVFSDLLGSIIEGIYKESKDGRVIIAGYRG